MTSARLSSLDGLRGVAATVVMLYHLSLVARPFLDTGQTGDAWWWLTQTPLKLITAGTESVLIFFVLSGLVVTLPALRDGFSFTGFMATRMLRLYLPVWASLVLAGLLIVIVPREVDAVTAGAWIDRANAHSLDLTTIVSEASLFRSSYDVNNVLWSLRWEVIFSLALPLFVGVAWLVRRQWLIAAALATALMVVGRVTTIDALVYLPVFLLGSLFAVRMPQLTQWASRRSSRFWAALTAASLGLLIASWLARPVEGHIGADVLWALSGVGAAGIIVVAIGSPLAQRALDARPVRWLGRVSFSLYLVQAPIIATLAFGLGDHHWPWVIALGIPLCVLGAWVFHTIIEKPSHRLARRFGASVDRARQPISQTAR